MPMEEICRCYHYQTVHLDAARQGDRLGDCAFLKCRCKAFAAKKIPAPSLDTWAAFLKPQLDVIGDIEKAYAVRTKPVRTKSRGKTWAAAAEAYAVRTKPVRTKPVRTKSRTKVVRTSQPAPSVGRRYYLRREL